MKILATKKQLIQYFQKEREKFFKMTETAAPGEQKRLIGKIETFDFVISTLEQWSEK